MSWHLGEHHDHELLALEPLQQRWGENEAYKFQNRKLLVKSINLCTHVAVVVSMAHIVSTKFFLFNIPVCRFFAELLFISTRKLSLIAHRHKHITHTRTRSSIRIQTTKNYGLFLLLYFPHIIIMIFALIVFHAASFAINAAFSRFVITICSKHILHIFLSSNKHQTRWFPTGRMISWTLFYEHQTDTETNRTELNHYYRTEPN